MANLLRWFKDRKDEVQAQVNMFDGGQTASTVRAARNPSIAPNVRNARYGVLAGNQQAQNNLLNDVKPESQNVAKTVLGSTMDTIRDTFDANSASDIRKRTAAGKPASYFDEQKQLGNKRPYQNVGAALAGSSARFLNTANAAQREVIDTTRMTAAQLTGNNTAMRNALQANKAFKQRAYQPNSGLFGQGTIFNNPEEFNTLGAKDLTKRVAAVTGGTALEVAPLAKGAGIASKLLSKAPNALARSTMRAGAGFAQNASQDVLEQQFTRDNYSPLQTLLSGGFGGALANAGPAGSALINRAKPAVNQAIDRTRASMVPLNQGGYVKNPFAVNNPDGAKIGGFRINNPDGARVGGLPINNPMGAKTRPLPINNPGGAAVQRALNIQNKTGAPLVGDNLSGAAQQSYLSKMRNKMTPLKGNEAGFVKNPFGKDLTKGLSKEQSEFINDYAEMLEGMGSGNGVSKVKNPDGSYVRVSDNFRTAENKGKAMTKSDWFEQARQEIESGKAGFGASDEYATLPKAKPEAEVAPKASAGEEMTPESYANAFGVSIEKAKQDLAPPPKGFIMAESKVRGGKKETLRAFKGDERMEVSQQTESAFAPLKGDPTAPIVDATRIKEPLKDIADKTQDISQKPAKKEFMDTTSSYLGAKEAGKTANVGLVRDLPKLKGGESLKLMGAIEKGVQDDNFNGMPQTVRKVLDAKYRQLRESGVDIGYLQDYFPHKWKNATQDQVNQAYQQLSLRKGIQNERVIPTIEEGMELGFVPDTTDYRVALNRYLDTADTLMANRKYFDNLKGKGLIAEAGSRPNGMQVIDAPGLPQPAPFKDPQTGDMIQGNYYAKPDVARELNKLFGEQAENKVLKATGKVSGGIQNIFLSGGAPGTPLNAFGLAQWQKQAMAGNAISSTKSFFRSFSDKKTTQFFKDNQSYIRQMQEDGVPFRSSVDTESLKSISERVAEAEGGGSKLKTLVAESFDAAMSDPTFKRFLPAMQVDTYKKVYEKAIKKNTPPAQARQIAADATRNVFGINTLAKDALKDKNANNAISTFFFAPKFRESMINFWLDNARSVKNISDPAFAENRKFLASATVLFGAMQAANMALNDGKTTFENENKWDKLNLSIPTGDGKSVAVPYLSSIATVPRNLADMGISIAKGQPKEAGLKAKSFLSMGVRPFVDLASNQNFSGNPIYNPKDSAGERAVDQTTYLAGQFNQPWVRAGLDRLTGKSESNLQTAATAFEAPLRFRNSGNTGKEDSIPKGAKIGIGSDTVKNEKTGKYETRNKYDAIVDALGTEDGTSRVNDYDDKQLRTALKEVNDEVNKELTSRGLKPVNGTTQVAKIWSEYKRQKKQSDLEGTGRIRGVLRDVYKTQLSEDSRAILKLSDNDIRVALEDGKIDKKTLEAAIGMDDYFMDQGLSLTPNVGNRLREELGYARKSSGKGRGGGGKKTSIALLSKALKQPDIGKAKQSNIKVARPSIPSFKQKTPRVASRSKKKSSGSLKVTKTKMA